MRPSATAMDQATSRVLNWRRPGPTSSAWTPKEVTYSRPHATAGAPQPSLDIRNRQGRQCPGAGSCCGAGPGAGAVPGPGSETLTPAGGRIQPVAGPASGTRPVPATRGPGPTATPA